MQRRGLLKLGVGATAALLFVGGGLALVQPGMSQGRLTIQGREVFEAIARAVLDGSWPTAADARAQALKSHLQRLDDTLAAFPAAVQSELSQLLSILASTAGRITLAGLTTPWPDASTAQIQAALQSMRISSLSLRQQAYHALRDLTNAAYFADAATWQTFGYPGPRNI